MWACSPLTGNLRVKTRFTGPIYLYNRLKTCLSGVSIWLHYNFSSDRDHQIRMRSHLFTGNCYLGIKYSMDGGRDSLFAESLVHTLSVLGWTHFFPVYTMVYKRIFNFKKVSFSKTWFQYWVGQSIIKPTFSTHIVHIRQEPIHTGWYDDSVLTLTT